MENVYTCSCGNQTWLILETAVRCQACNREFTTEHTPVTQFNHAVLEEIEELEEV